MPNFEIFTSQFSCMRIFRGYTNIWQLQDHCFDVVVETGIKHSTGNLYTHIKQQDAYKYIMKWR